MEPPDEVYRIMREIDAWATAQLPIPEANTDEEFMHLVSELMTRAHYLLRLGVSLTPDAKRAERGWTKPRAIVLGHLVRIMKLYDALCLHISEGHAEICLIFHRLLLETVNRMEYLIKAPKASFRSFVLVSHKAEREIVEDLRQKSARRKLTPIEARMLKSTMRNLSADRITLRQLRTNKTWELDGKNFRQILTALGRDWTYAYGFGKGSHWVHGDWVDIKTNHLVRNGRLYQPRWWYGKPDPRIACPITMICLWALMRFVNWSHTDPDDFVLPILDKVCKVAELLDAKHEQFLIEERKLKDS